MDYTRRRDSGGGGGPVHSNNQSNNQDQTTPICRCRVLYLGSAVPHLSKDGLQGVQEPLRELYPEYGVPGVTSIGPNGTSLPLNNSSAGGSGIDSWISVWSNGILVENVDDYGREMRRFFPIESLHYCAAVRYVNLPEELNNNGSVGSGIGATGKFLPLDSPFLRQAKSDHPPLFACILRRTTGIKVLECHAFVCKREAAANALVRCCFHAYADNMYVKQIDENPYSQIESNGSANGVEFKDDSCDRQLDCLDGAPSRSARSSIRTIRNNGNMMESKNQANNELSSDTELHTSNSSSAGNRSPVNEEDEREMCRSVAEMNGGRRSVDPQLLGGYKLWSGSKSLSGSVKDLNLLSSMNGSKLSKCLSIRSLRPSRQIPVQHMINMPGNFPPQFIQPPMYAHPMAHPAFVGPQMPAGQPFEKMDKSTLKLLKKLKSKSMASLIPNAAPMPQPQLMFVPPLPPHFAPNHTGPFAAMPIPMPPVPITGNLHTIKKKSKKNKELQKLQAQQQQWLAQQQQMMMQAGAFIPNQAPPPPELLHAQGQPMYMPPMRPLTPLHSNYGHPPESAMSGYLTGPRRKSNCELDQQLPLPSLPTNPTDDDTPFNSGIYRRKGHLNERAFSYSIRQEQRSRSGSLANLMADEPDVYFESPETIHDSHSNQNGNDSRLSAALRQLQLDGAPKTASIKRSQLNSLGQLRPNCPIGMGPSTSHLNSSAIGGSVSKLRQVQPPAPPTLNVTNKPETKKKSNKK